MANTISERARWLAQEIPHPYTLSDEKAQEIMDAFESQGGLQNRDLKNILGGVAVRDEYVEVVAKAAKQTNYFKASAGVLVAGVGAGELAQWWGAENLAVEIPTVGAVLVGGVAALGVASIAMNPSNISRPGFSGNDSNSIIYFGNDANTMTFDIPEPVFAKPLAMSATTTSASPSGPSSPGGASAATPPEEKEPEKEAKPGLRDAAWWRPWRVPSRVEEEMDAIWKNESLSLEQRNTQAAQALLCWRLARIPDPARRELALQVMETSFTEAHVRGRTIRTTEDIEAWLEELFSIFPEPIRNGAHRTVGGFNLAAAKAKAADSSWFEKVGFGDFFRRSKDMSWFARSSQSSGYVTRENDVWVNPRLREIPGGSAVANVVVHEAGGHFGALNGASGPFQFWTYRVATNTPRIVLDPLQPVTGRAFTFVAEGDGIGAQWELVHRMPPEVRTEQMELIRRELGEHADLLEEPLDVFSRRDSLWGHFGRDDYAANVRYNMLVMEYRYLEAAELPKGEFIRVTRRMIGYSPDQLVHAPIRAAWRLAEQQEAPSMFWVPFTFQTAKAAAGTGAAIWAYKKYKK